MIYQFQHTPSVKITVIYFFQSMHQHRMMRQQQICFCIDGMADHFSGRIQCDINALDLFLIASHLQSRIIPGFCDGWRIFFLQ